MCFTDLVVTNRHRGLDALLAGLEGSQHMVAAVQRERGLIVLTGHLGNWELEGRLMTTAVARPRGRTLPPWGTRPPALRGATKPD
jgi:lauroyl/myristoyl acyltransferase